MTVLYWLLAAVSAPLIGAEVIEWCRPAQRFLVGRIAAKLPPEHRERYTEEWMAELNEVPGGQLTRFFWTASLLFRRRRLATELRQRNRDVSDLLWEIRTRPMRAVLHQRMLPNYRGYERIIVAEEPDGKRHAWRLEGRLLTPVMDPDKKFDLEHVSHGDIQVLSDRAGISAAESERPSSPGVGEVGLPISPSPVFRTEA